MPRYCLTVDLINDSQLIAEYEDHHRRVWPEIEASIKNAGIIAMEIYRYENRLFMIMDTNHSFSFESKNAIDKANIKVQQWETLMWNYQQALPTARKGEKWLIMKKIFELNT